MGAVKITCFKTQIVKIELCKNVKGIEFLTKTVYAGLIAEASESVVSLFALCIKTYDCVAVERNDKTALFVAVVFEGCKQHLKLALFLQKSRGDGKTVRDLFGDKEIFAHDKVIVFQLVKGDDVKFIDADGIFRNEKIVANTHTTKISVVEDLECVYKCNLLCLGFCYTAVEKVNRLIERSFCVCR